jgi:hypothetical protein
MKLVPTRRSKKQKAIRAAGKVGKKAVKAKAVQKAPKTAVAVWAGRRSGKILRGAVIAVAGVVTLKALRKKRQGSSGGGSTSPESYRSSPTPASSQQSPKPDPAAPKPSSAAEKEGVAPTPPHGDPLMPKDGAPGPTSASNAARS